MDSGSRRRQAGRNQEARISAHAASQLGHTSTRERDGSSNDSVVVGPRGAGSHDRLFAPLASSSSSGGESVRDVADSRTGNVKTIQKEKEATMTRPTVEVADIFRSRGNDFIGRHSLGIQQLKAIRAITRCRTAALGGHVDVCPQCGGDPAISYNSCRDRHCNKCQAQARRRWIDARKQELLETRYFHVVFTLPHELHTLVLQNQSELYNLLFRTVAETLRDVARSPEHLGAEIGFFGILHTWGQNLLFHPHIHCVIPGGGISSDGKRWIHPRYPFFLPVRALGKVFRGKFVAGLRQALRKNRLTCAGTIQRLAEPKNFAAFLRTLFRQDWVVYAKPAFGGPEQVIRYLGRYTHRVAISNHRLMSFDGDHVTFRWRDYTRGNKQRLMTVSAEEFIRRFLVHVLP